MALPDIKTRCEGLAEGESKSFNVSRDVSLDEFDRLTRELGRELKGHFSYAYDTRTEMLLVRRDSSPSAHEIY